MMNDCSDGDIRDRLPGYVHDTLPPAERSAVAAHLATCDDCRAEVELIEAAARAFPAPAVNVRRIVAALPSPPRRGLKPAFWGRAQQIAAAIGIVAIGAFSAIVIRDRSRAAILQPVAQTPPADTGKAIIAAAPTPVAPAAPVVDSLGAATQHPRAVSRGRAAMSFGGGLSDLSEDQLDTLLGELDNLDALPSVEPETHITPILPPADGGHGAR